MKRLRTALRDVRVEIACPVCGDMVQVPDDALDGEIVECSGCGAQLEVVKKEGAVSLKLLEGVEEDWGE